MRTAVGLALALAWAVSGCTGWHGESASAGYTPRLTAGDAIAAAGGEARFDVPMVTEAEPDVLMAVVEPRRVVYTAQLGIVVRDIPEAIDATQAVAERRGGYMQRITGSGIVIRVPAEQFNATVDELARLGPMPRREIRAQDVTDQYTDLELRLANAHRLRDKLASLLDRAESIEDALAVEKELARVTTEIERLEGQLQKLRNEVALATIAVGFTLQEHAPHEMQSRLPFHWLRTLGVENLLYLY